MDLLKCCIVLAALVWWAGGAPGHDTLHMDLSLIRATSVCPIREVIDEDKTRVPRLIKTLVCDKKPSAVCTAKETSQACCLQRHYHRNFSTQCVEVLDTVWVQYEGSDKLEPIQVPVGCTCMIQMYQLTKDLP